MREDKDLCYLIRYSVNANQIILAVLEKGRDVVFFVVEHVNNTFSIDPKRDFDCNTMDKLLASYKSNKIILKDGSALPGIGDPITK